MQPINKLVLDAIRADDYFGIDVRISADETKSFPKLLLTYRSIMKAENECGINFGLRASWTNVSASSLSVLCWACFETNYPEVTLEDVRGFLVPAHYDQLWVMLYERCFPGSMQMAEELSRRKNGAGESEPSPSEARN
jgi:hypothetical protein